MNLFTVKYQDMHLIRYKALDNKGNFALIFSKNHLEAFDEDDYILELCRKKMDCQIEIFEEKTENLSEESYFEDWL